MKDDPKGFAVRILNIERKRVSRTCYEKFLFMQRPGSDKHGEGGSERLFVSERLDGVEP